MNSCCSYFVLSLVLLSLSCSPLREIRGARLSEPKVLAIAVNAAQEAGYDMDDYILDDIRPQFHLDSGYWLLEFPRRNELLIINPWYVRVDDETGEARIRQ